MVEDVGKHYWKAKPHLNTMTFREVYYRRIKVGEIAKELGYKTLNETIFINAMERDFAKWKYDQEFHRRNEVNENFDKEDDIVNNFVNQLQVTT